MTCHRKAILVLQAIGLAFLICACSSVTTKHPLTAHPKPIDREEFEGCWIMGNTVFHLRFASNGIARIAALEWKNDQFSLGGGEMMIAEGDKHNFICVRFEEDGKWPDEYLFLPYKFTDQGDLVLWLPDEDAFEEAIKKKTLHGVVNKQEHSKSVTITNSPDKLLEFINGPDALKLFDYREPMVLRKAVGAKKPAKKRRSQKQAGNR